MKVLIKYSIVNWLKGDYKQVSLIPSIDYWWDGEGSHMISLRLFFIEFQVWFGKVEEVVSHGTVKFNI